MATLAGVLGLAMGAAMAQPDPTRDWTKTTTVVRPSGAAFQRTATYQRDVVSGAFTRDVLTIGDNGKTRTIAQTGTVTPGAAGGGTVRATSVAVRPSGVTDIGTVQARFGNGSWERVTTYVGSAGTSTRTVQGSLDRANGVLQRLAVIVHAGGAVTARSTSGTVLGNQVRTITTSGRPGVPSTLSTGGFVRR